MKNPIYYFTSCGCKLYLKDIKHTYGIRTCREHGGVIIMRTRNCMECDIEFKMRPTGRGDLRCPVCKKKHLDEVIIRSNKRKAKRRKLETDAADKKLRKIKKKIKKKPKPEFNPIPVKMRGFCINKFGDYCRNLPGCIAMHKKLNCEDCADFVHVFDGLSKKLNSVISRV